jgi:predicted Zn finger-like uncharacterized protein
VKFLCDQCKAKYQIADDKVAGKTVRMKCRKCGHLIEVRAAVTETSVATESAPPPAVAGPAASATPAPGATAPAAPKPGPPRAAPPKPGGLPPKAPLAAKPPAKPAAPSALAGAFKSNVQREEEVSTPFDMSELAPDDTWYVAINGVPVGPIKISEVRRKASLGAVTEDSLVWQEGQDEWRPARQLPDLAAIIREASSARTSITPPPGRVSTPPPRSGAAGMAPRPPMAGGAVPSVRTSRPPGTAPLPAAAARNNVVPITSRLATAEKLAQPEVAPDPFAVPAPAADAAASAAMAPPGAASPLVASAMQAPSAALAAAPPPEIVYRKQPPWIIIGMMLAFAAFGVTAGVELLRPAPPAPAPVIVQVPVAPTAQPVAAPTATASSEPTATAATPVAKAPTGGGGPRVAAAAPPSGRSLDLHSLAANNNVGPGEDLGQDGPKAPGQCFSQGQVQQVIGLHQVSIRRACWERDPSTKPSVNVSVSMTIGADGSAQGVSASGDEASVAKCIENDVRGWHFPAMGCAQKTAFSFKFVRQ